MGPPSPAVATFHGVVPLFLLLFLFGFFPRAVGATSNRSSWSTSDDAQASSEDRAIDQGASDVKFSRSFRDVNSNVTLNLDCRGDVNGSCDIQLSGDRNESYEAICSSSGKSISCVANVLCSDGRGAPGDWPATDVHCTDGRKVKCVAWCGAGNLSAPNCSCIHDIVDLFDLINYAKPEFLMVDKCVSLVTYCIGFPGNIVSFIVWIQRRMRHSSGFYLAALAMDDFIFLSLHVVFELHSSWGFQPLNTPVFCQVYPVLFLTAQYLGPLLVLGFTTERYISICHPFKREKYCTVRRAKIVVGILVTLAVSLSGVQGYFYSYKENDCGPRDIVREGGSTSLLILWNLSIEILTFVLVPLAILVLNIFVIADMRRLSRMEQVTLHHGHSQRTSATTVMLLAVSFYLILTVLPVTIAYTVYYEFEINEELRDPLSELVLQPRVQRHINYQFALACIREIGITHYAFNIIIYVTTGKAFRKELKRLVVKGVCGKLSRSLSKEYSSLRSSFRREGSKSQGPLVGKSLYVSINGHTTTTTVAADSGPLPLPPSANTVISEPTDNIKMAATRVRPPTTTLADEEAALRDPTDNGVDTTETNL